MATSTWDIDGHPVSLTHNYWSGVATLTVDDEVAFLRPTALFDLGFAHRFDVHGTPAAVRVFTNGFTFRHVLVTGDEALQIQESNSQPLENPAVLVLGLLAMGLVGLGAVAVAAILAYWFVFNASG